MADPRRIDVHHHVTPPSYIAAASQITYGNAPRMSWSLERSLDDMDKGGVQTAIISLPHPVTIWPEPKDKQRALAKIESWDFEADVRGLRRAIAQVTRKIRAE